MHAVEVGGQRAQILLCYRLDRMVRLVALSGKLISLARAGDGAEWGHNADDLVMAEISKD
eukprot:684860-Pleurochrysis_carterae.AAC.3